MGERTSARQFHEADGTGDWRPFPEGAYAFFRSQSFAASVRLVEAIGRLASGGGEPDIAVVWVPWDEAESRVAAGVAAGGRVIRQNVDERFWTLADPAGNEVDIAMTTPPQSPD